MDPTLYTPLIAMLIEAISGPAAAAIIMVALVASAIYKGFPLLASVFQAHNDFLKSTLADNKENLNALMEDNRANQREILAEHAKDRDAWKQSIKETNKNMEKLGDRLGNVETEIKRISKS